MVTITRRKFTILLGMSLVSLTLLDEVAGLGVPTLESLCSYIAGQLSTCPGLSTVRVWRDSAGDSCTLRIGAAR